LRLLLVTSQTTNSDQMQQLAELLQQEAIDFSISGLGDDAGAIAQQILQSHPATVQLQVLRKDFPEVWQQTLKARTSLTQTTGLVTGLVVARETILKRLIAQVLGITSEQQNQLQLRQGTISVIHYPSAEQSPMLQAMNIGGSIMENC
jgi:phosphoserine phosphatase